MSRIPDWDGGARFSAMEQTLPAYSEVCKIVSKSLNEAHPEEHLEGEMIQSGCTVR
jgi:hypothetical protein